MDLDTLFDAAIAGDAGAIAKLEKQADIVNEYKQSSLHNESKRGNTERVRFILREFANKNLLPILNIYKHNALQVVAVYGHTEVAELLIDAARHLPPSANDNNHDNAVTSFQAFLREVDNDMDSALHAAVTNGNVAIVKLLVEADPTDRHTQNRQGKTPMYIAVEKGFNDIVEIICTTCTAPSLDGPGGATALHAAISNINKAKKNDKDVIRMIINSAKCSSTPQDAPHESFEALFNKTDGSGRTVLELAVMGNYVNIVDLILEEDRGCQHSRRSKKNDLMPLICKAIDEEYDDIVELLSKTYEVGDYRGAVALILAIKRRDKEGASDVISMIINASKHWSSAEDASLIDFEALFRRTDELGSTILQLAVERNYVDTVRLILLEDPAYQHGREIKRNGLMRLIYKAIDNRYSDDIVKLLP